MSEAAVIQTPDGAFGAYVAAEIDKIIEKKLADNKVPTSAQADDAEFLRRTSLDIRGRIPKADRTISFLRETSWQRWPRAHYDS